MVHFQYVCHDWCHLVLRILNYFMLISKEDQWLYCFGIIHAFVGCRTQKLKICGVAILKCLFDFLRAVVITLVS